MKQFYLFCLLLIIAGCGNPEESQSNNKQTEQDNPSSTETLDDEDSNMPDQDKVPMSQMQSAHNRTVVFYNVENLFDTKDDPKTSDDDFTPNGIKKWDEERYKKKVRDLSNVLSSISEEVPAIIGLAEIENKKVLVDLIHSKELKDQNYSIVHEESPDNRGIDVALLIDEDVFKYEYHESIRIDFPWDSDIKTRDILHVVGHFRYDDKVHIFVNHWPSRRDGVAETEPKRLEVAGKLRETLDDIYLDENDPKIIVMGDFNDAPDNKSVEFVLGCKNAEEFELGKSGLEDDELLNLSYPHLLSIDYKHNELGTLVHEGQWEILDQMMCSNGILNNFNGIQIQSASVIFNPDWILYKRKDGSSTPNKTYGGPKYYGGYSDHLPVYLTLKDVQ